MRAVSRLCELYPGICLTTVEKGRENLSQDSRRVPAGTMKTEYTEQNIFYVTSYNIHSYCYLLTPWCRVLLEKLTGLQLVKKFPAFHGTRRFITALTSVRHLSLSWVNLIQSIYPHPTSCRSVLILSTHLRLGLPSGLLPSGFPTKNLHTPSPHPYMPSPSHSSRFYHPHNIG